MSDESGEKTEEPSAKKLEDSRKKGQVWKSRDLSGALVFMAGFFTMAAIFPTMLARFRGGFLGAFARIGRPIPPEEIAMAAYEGLGAVMMLTLPALLAAALTGAVADFLQVGAIFTFEPMVPKLEKLDPVEGVKRLFSKKQLIELIKSTVKLALAGYVAYGVVRDELRLVVSTAHGTPDLILVAVGTILWKLATRVSMLFVVFAIFDVWLQRRSYMKDLMMTKEEVKREYKESEGDPHHKAKRKEMHQEILEGAMMNEVASADVVITNPDHCAVALRYRGARGAPQVVAKGVDLLAQQIKAVARAAAVPTVEDVPLARALVGVELGDEIPEELFDAVAAVLSWVYSVS